jgi:hypothetical protein
MDAMADSKRFAPTDDGRRIVDPCACRAAASADRHGDLA